MQTVGFETEQESAGFQMVVRADELITNTRADKSYCIAAGGMAIYMKKVNYFADPRYYGRYRPNPLYRSSVPALPQPAPAAPVALPVPAGLPAPAARPLRAPIPFTISEVAALRRQPVPTNRFISALRSAFAFIDQKGNLGLNFIRFAVLFLLFNAAVIVIGLLHPINAIGHWLHPSPQHQELTASKLFEEGEIPKFHKPGEPTNLFGTGKAAAPQQRRQSLKP